MARLQMAIDLLHFYYVSTMLPFSDPQGLHMAGRKKLKSAAPTDERDPRERFISLANSRVTSAIHQIRLIGNLANKKNYQYGTDDAAKITRALQRELDELKAKFKGEDKSESTIFSL